MKRRGYVGKSEDEFGILMNFEKELPQKNPTIDSIALENIILVISVKA